MNKLAAKKKKNDLVELSNLSLRVAREESVEQENLVITRKKKKKKPGWLPCVTTLISGFFLSLCSF
jgi:hypothetical protein